MSGMFTCMSINVHCLNQINNNYSFPKTSPSPYFWSLTNLTPPQSWLHFSPRLSFVVCPEACKPSLCEYQCYCTSLSGREYLTEQWEVGSFRVDRHSPRFGRILTSSRAVSAEVSLHLLKSRPALSELRALTSIKSILTLY